MKEIEQLQEDINLGLELLQNRVNKIEGNIVNLSDSIKVKMEELYLSINKINASMSELSRELFTIRRNLEENSATSATSAAQLAKNSADW